MIQLNNCGAVYLPARAAWIACSSRVAARLARVRAISVLGRLLTFTPANVTGNKEALYVFNSMMKLVFTHTTQQTKSVLVTNTDYQSTKQSRAKQKHLSV